MPVHAPLIAPTRAGAPTRCGQAEYLAACAVCSSPQAHKSATPFADIARTARRRETKRFCAS
jgi:hypothetical protein